MAFPRNGVRTYSDIVTTRFARARASSHRTSVVVRNAVGAVYRDLTDPADPAEPIMALHARTFRFATRFFPPQVRAETIQLYAFFRTLDDLVDESDRSGGSLETVRVELDSWRRWFSDGMDAAPPRAEIGVPLAGIVRSRQIPVDYFLSFLDGMQADLGIVRMRTRADVEAYSYQVASTVGLAMCHVFGTTSSRARDAACRLGVAMQLTNILRDVGGDLARGRLYLPLDLLERHELRPGELEDMWRAGRGPDDRLRHVLAEVVTWADQHYLEGQAGVALLPESIQLPVLLASRLYQRILRQLERNDYDSLRSRVATGRLQKLHTLSTCLLSPIDDVYAARTTHDIPGSVPAPEGE